MDELNVKQLASVIRNIAEEKNLPEEIVLDIVEQAIAAAWRRDHGDREQEVRAEMNINTGTAKVFISKTVVDEVVNSVLEISLDDAKKLDPKAEIDGIVEETDQATTFGRVAAQTAKQVSTAETS